MSEQTRREVRGAFDREAPVISNGVDLGRFSACDPTIARSLRERLALADGDRLILSVGGVEPRKNSLIALEAVARAFADQPRLRWLLVGGASIWEHARYRAEFAARLAELPHALQARITLLGIVTEAELTVLYQLSELLLYPSLQEGFGLCVLEAMAAKVAVIAPRGAPFDEYLDDDCASLVDPSSPAQIASAISSLLQDRKLRERLALHGYLRAQRYSWDRVAERHVVHYRALLADSDSRASESQSDANLESDHA